MAGKWIIEKRNEDGSLDFSRPQPEDKFGKGAINGMTDWQMSRMIFAAVPDAQLHGTNIPNWPRLIDPKFVARVKHW